MKDKQKKVLVLGASGMLGNAVFRFFVQSKNYYTYGTVRSQSTLSLFPEFLQENLKSGINVENIDSLVNIFTATKPDIVINCIGLVKQHVSANDVLSVIPINTLLPHRLAQLCAVSHARLIHISTDCVFSGSRGMYTEDDLPDAMDLYGRSKLLGEVDYPNAITLRTSVIGHELEGARSLVGWFLAQRGRVLGYKNAIFSGLPTVEVARLIRDHVIPHANLHGLYHVSAEPINKYELLKLIAEVYEKEIKISEDQQYVINRSLDSSRFRITTGFTAKPWHELVQSMRDFQ